MYAQLQAYKRVENVTLPDGRELEASILTKAAHLLTQCKNNWEDKDIHSRLDEALCFNQRIWTIFQSDLCNPENPLPQKLREDILNLSLFIDKRIMEIRLDPLPEKLNIIVSINLNLAAGLKGIPKNN